MFSLLPSRRARALESIDANIDTLLVTGDTITASEVMQTVGLAVWKRAQQLLARPVNLPVYPEERAIHDVAKGVVKLQHLPVPPTPSPRLGDSETDWARSLFETAAQFVSRREGRRTVATRLALATYVVREQWTALDSAANAVLATYPHDSVAPMARALARFHAVRDAVVEYPVTMALFDTALRALPRVDSAAFDAFDELLKWEDDRWRREHLLEELSQLDARSWSVFDPIWLTEVNEIQLVRRARKAEADFRYAHLTRPGQSGSETPLGIMLLRRGVPDARWTLTEGDNAFVYRRGWPSKYSTTYEIRDDPMHWMSMYNDIMGLEFRINLLLKEGRLCDSFALTRTLFNCARDDFASWHDVPFELKQDTVDVITARFRATPASVDMYFGARFPTRKFPHREQSGFSAADSVVYGVIVAGPDGEKQFESQTHSALPGPRDLSWKADWRARVDTGNMMHRVEAYEPRSLASARGSRKLTSTSAATFVTSGFGMSDILVADSIAAQRSPVRNWRDLRTVPNGAVLMPGGSIAMAWEVYGLSRGTDGRSRWRVTLSREDGSPVVNANMRSLIIGDPAAGVKVTSAEPDASLISFTRNEPALPVVVEYIRFTPPEVSEGQHVLRVRIEDLGNNRITQRSVSIRVLNEKAQAR